MQSWNTGQDIPEQLFKWRSCARTQASSLFRHWSIASSTTLCRKPLTWSWTFAAALPRSVYYLVDSLVHRSPKAVINRIRAVGLPHCQEQRTWKSRESRRRGSTIWGARRVGALSCWKKLHHSFIHSFIHCFFNLFATRPFAAKGFQTIAPY